MDYKKLLSVFALLILGIILGYVYIGFFHQDPDFIQRVRWLYLLVFLWIPRIFIPLFYLGLVYLFLFASKKEVKNTIFLVFILGGFFLIVYPFTPIISGVFMSDSGNKKDYHPYLQLMPPELDSLQNVAGNQTSRILCLGGSTTEWKDSDGVGWPQRVEEQLHSGLNDSFQVVNLGRQWYTTLHSLINYESNLRHHKHDVIILMHAINDLFHNADFSLFSRGSFREDYGHFYGPLKDVFDRENSTFFGDIMTMFGRFWYQEPIEIVEQMHFPGLKTFERNVNTLIDLAEISGVQVILMTQPTLLGDNMNNEITSKFHRINRAVGENKKWSYQTALRGMEQYNNMLKNIAEERSVHLIDLEKEIPKTLDYFTDEVHYTDKSYDLIASVIFDYLQKNDFNSKVIVSE